MKEKISVIIPVYNVASYLEECLMSVLKQTFDNLEVICIDDGSTDGSGEICDKFAKEDSRVIVIHQNNRGAGAARNKGLEIATGEYITFVDSDDYISSDMYSALYCIISETNADIVACEIVSVYQNRQEIISNTKKKEIYSGIEFLKLTTIHWKYYTMINKLFRRELLKGMKFPEGNIIDDGFFTYKIIAKAKEVIWYDNALYFYRRRKSSVMNLEEYHAKRDYDMIIMLREKLEFVKKNCPDIVDVFQKKMMDSYVNFIMGEAIDKVAIKKCVRYMRKNCLPALFKEYTIKESIWFVGFMLFPNLMKQRKIRREKITEKLKEANLHSQDIFFE